jgi:F-type H+-transporting ATPase subunit gamma
MSRRRELEQRLRKLAEIGEILRSMKNLALMETRKLARLLEAEQAAVRAIEAVAADFLRFHPRFAQAPATGSQGVLAIGTERGFCGDFNEELLAALKPGDAPLVAVGGKLCARLDRHPALAGQFDGPVVAEDVPAILNRLAPATGRLWQAGGCAGLEVLHHRAGEQRPCRKSLLPPFTQASAHDPADPAPPLLSLAPEIFFAELVRQYLLAALQEIFHASLMAENQRRIQHLEGAIQRLEEKIAGFARQSRILRQEDITEEIEVILLGAEGMGQSKPGGEGWPSGPQ